MTTILVAGATGDLGHRIVTALVAKGADVRVLTRASGSSSGSTRRDLEGPHVAVVEADYDDGPALRAACEGVDAVVSAVNGLRDVIVGAQTALLEAAVATGVPRFVPSDFSADYRRIPAGSNRNLELRREFAAVLDAAPIRATSVLNGAFADMLTGQAPIVIFDRRLVLFWSHPGQVLDFTTKDDVAAVTADVALDPDAPRVVEVAGDRVTSRQLAATLTELTGERHRLQWAGTTTLLGGVAGLMRRLSHGDEPFPAWQGMQYLVNMYSGDAQLRHVDRRGRGPSRWTTVGDVLADHLGLPR